MGSEGSLYALDDRLFSKGFQVKQTSRQIEHKGPCHIYIYVYVNGNNTRTRNTGSTNSSKNDTMNR